MPINEPRIYPVLPPWAGLKEISRGDSAVWFRTRAGRLRASLKEVEAYERRQK